MAYIQRMPGPDKRRGRIFLSSRNVLLLTCLFVLAGVLVAFTNVRPASAGGAVSITTSSLPDATIGQLYSAGLSAAGGTGTYTWTMSGLPPGLTLTSTSGTGKIGGYPWQESGTFTVDATVYDTAGQGTTATFILTVKNASLPSLSITCHGPFTATVGESYSATVTASGGLGDYSWQVENLPVGFQLTTSGDSATIHGIPTVSGLSLVFFKVCDSVGRRTDCYLKLTIKPASTGNSSSSQTGFDNTPGHWSVDSSGGTLTTADNSVSLEVPAGAFGKQVPVSLWKLSFPYPLSAGFVSASPQWSIQAVGAQPAQAVTITLSYDPKVLGKYSPSRLGLYRYDPASGSWIWVGGTVDTGSNTVTANTFYLGTFAVQLNDQVFQDLGQTPWVRTAVDALLGAGVVGATAPGQFDPGGEVTRAQLAVMLAKAAHLAPIEGTTPFVDVPAKAWYAPYVAAAYNAGMVSGEGNRIFHPDGLVTREQMAVMIARLLGSSATAGDATQFTDYASIDSWAVSGVDAVLGSSIMEGYPDGTFRPYAIITRAEAAVTLYNYIQFSETQ